MVDLYIQDLEKCVWHGIWKLRVHSFQFQYSLSDHSNVLTQVARIWFPSPPLIFFFRVDKFSINLQKNFRELRSRTPTLFKRFYKIQVFHSENIKIFPGDSAPEPPIFELVRNWLSRLSSIWYSHQISRNCYKIQGFHCENIEIFQGAPPTDLQCFAPKKFSRR